MVNWIKAFWEAHKITTHSLAAATATLVMLYAEVPAFADLVNKGYAATPQWFHEVAVAAVGIYAFYHGTSKV